MANWTVPINIEMLEVTPTESFGHMSYFARIQFYLRLRPATLVQMTVNTASCIINISNLFILF